MQDTFNVPSSRLNKVNTVDRLGTDELTLLKWEVTIFASPCTIQGHLINAKKSRKNNPCYAHKGWAWIVLLPFGPLVPCFCRQKKELFQLLQNEFGVLKF